MKMKNGVTQLQEKENTAKSSGMAVTNDIILTRSAAAFFVPNLML